MATRSQRRAMTKGRCAYCESEIDKNKMTQHLKFCKKRAAAIAAEIADDTKPKQKLFHLLVEGRYNPQYWMHIEMPASAPLYALDDFLRDVWVECCDHLSAFRIGGVSYEYEPPDFADFSIKIVSPLDQEEQVNGVEEDDELEEEYEEDDMDVEEEEYEDFSPEEIAEEMGRYLDELPPVSKKLLSDDLQADLRKPRSRDELVAFLKEKLASQPELKVARTFKSEEAEMMLPIANSPRVGVCGYTG